MVQLEAPDDYTIRFHFAAPYGLFLKVLASNFTYIVDYPAHFLKQYHPAFAPQAELDRLAHREGFDFWYQVFDDRAEWQNPDTPRLWAWTMERPPPARPVVFTRNPYYWKVDPSGRQLPYIDRVTFEIYDIETINIKAINGEVGMQGRHISFQNYPLFMTNRAKGRLPGAPLDRRKSRFVRPRFKPQPQGSGPQIPLPRPPFSPGAIPGPGPGSHQ